MATENQGDNIKKYDLKLKSRPKDGVILQLHHTIRGSNGESRRIRFTVGSFEDTQNKLACADNVGNIFLLNFADLQFWKLKNLGPCTALQFVPHDLETLVVATTKNLEVVFVDSETTKITLTLTGHTAPIKHISFSNSKINNLLTASPVEAILWELKNHTKYFTLNTNSGPQIQQILFTPASEYLVACFQNDTIQIWRHETMKSVKQIIPSELKHLKSVAFTMNGRAMAMSGLAPVLILFSMDTWKALKSIDLLKYNISGIQQLSFVPQIFDGGSNKILALLSSDCILYFLDIESLKVIHTIHPESSGIRKFVVSPTGKYFLCILQQGEVNIYNSSYVMDYAKSSLDETTPRNMLPCSSISRKCVEHSPKRVEVQQRMRICMDSARLRRILMQYGEYPDKFRSIIWRSLLVTPRNKTAYSVLVDKGIHPAYKEIENQFTIHSSVTLKNLKRLLSCLAHWCPLFGVMKFLPSFVFPFVKVLQKDPLLLFESVATVLLNQCQLWFEYAPFPPISILAMIENILAEHDQQLLNHFCDLGVTSQTYALKILETAFSEVLTCSEWLILWDHILSNEPAFILMAVVSYNIVQKNALRRLQSHEQLEKFFHMQNPIDKKSFLKKSYILLNETSDEIHPRRFFKNFMALDKGTCYQQFTGYPKATICLKLAKKTRSKTQKKDKYSLRELTTRTQEREINKNSSTKNESIEFENSSETDLEEYDNFLDRQSKGDKKNNHNSQGNGDHSNAIKDDLLNNMHYPPNKYFHKSKQKTHNKTSKRECTDCKASSHSKSNKRTSENKHILEKEVEKLIKGYKNSDRSED
ncbi:TBC1 domain family member 31 [Vanessa atalanta]|uniref:TBC1 domain family member 31 n=1 Tax=Vanessa atalanta TaxID=42275 RepID=UPI001FCE2D57|nr:TBC1 domain family member 31 [Vanessa atalanta]